MRASSSGSVFIVATPKTNGWGLLDKERIAAFLAGRWPNLSTVTATPAPWAIEAVPGSVAAAERGKARAEALLLPMKSRRALRGLRVGRAGCGDVPQNRTLRTPILGTS